MGAEAGAESARAAPREASLLNHGWWVYLSAREEIQDRAKLFDWTVDEQIYTDVITRADQCIQVTYRRDGTVERAERFYFMSLDDLKLVETTPDRHRKAQVMAWLATY